MNADQMKQEVIAFTTQWNIKPQDFIVCAGGAMLLRGYRLSSEDIDVAVGTDTFNALKHHLDTGAFNEPAKLLLNHGSGKPVIATGNLEIHLDQDRMTTQGEGEVIDGVCLQTLESIYALKAKLRRPKDKNDLVLLKILLDHPGFEVPRIPAAITVLHNELGEEFFNYSPRVLGVLVAQREWLDRKSIDLFTKSKTVSMAEHLLVAQLLVGNKLDGEESIVSMCDELIEEFALGVNFALDAIQY